MIKWGIIGLGNMGQKFASAIKETSNSKIISVASLDKNKIKNFKDNYNLNEVSVYNNYDVSERLIPFDLFPRILSSSEWVKIEKGIKQRSIAINAFLNDVYHRAECEKLLDSLSKEEQEKAEGASLLTARYLWNFLSGMTSKHKLENIAA